MMIKFSSSCLNIWNEHPPSLNRATVTEVEFLISVLVVARNIRDTGATIGYINTFCNIMRSNALFIFRYRKQSNFFSAVKKYSVVHRRAGKGINLWQMTFEGGTRL